MNSADVRLNGIAKLALQSRNTGQSLGNNEIVNMSFEDAEELVTPEDIDNFAFGHQVELFSKYEVSIKRSRTPSSDESGLLKALDQLQSRSPKSIINRVNTSDFDELHEICPNFSEVIDTVQAQVELGQTGRGYARVRPILLLGEPGVGKSHFARKLAEVCSSGFRMIDMASCTAGFTLSGGNSQWKDAKPGIVAEILTQPGNSANPVIVLDEIDKASASNKYDPLGPLYSLLEPSTSRLFRDEFLDIALDASYITWIATSNDLESIPSPLRSRMDIFTIMPPDIIQIRQIMLSAYRDVRHETGALHFIEECDSAAFDTLISEKISIRDIRRIISWALTFAHRDRRTRLESVDIKNGINKCRPSSSGRRVGFV